MAFGLDVLLLAASPCAVAGQLYMGLGTGIAYSGNERFDDTPMLLDYDLGFRLDMVTFGYAFDNGLRLELEGAQRRNDLEIIEFDDARGIVNTGLNDAVDSASLMANAIYEFDLGIVLRPYLGIGIGIAELDYELSDNYTDELILSDSDTAFAYQAIVGVGVPIGRRMHLSVDYRYWRHLEVDLQTEAGEPVSTEHPIQQASVTLSYAFGSVGTRQEAPGEEHEGTGWYNELRLGSIAAEDSDIEDGLVDTNFDAFDIGSALSFAVGYAWQRGSGGSWRGELELSRWQNHADVIDFGKLRGEFRLSGPVEILGVSGNLIYDFAPRATLRPYAGLGIGFAEVDYDVTLHEAGVATPYVDDSDFGFAVQALLGVGVRVTSRLQVSLNYRYWWAPAIELTNPQQESLKTEHSAHALMLGLRYRLGE